MERPRRNVTVFQLCYTTSPIVVPDVNNQAQRRKFVGHEQNVR